MRRWAHARLPLSLPPLTRFKAFLSFWCDKQPATVFAVVFTRAKPALIRSLNVSRFAFASVDTSTKKMFRAISLAVSSGQPSAPVLRKLLEQPTLVLDSTLDCANRKVQGHFHLCRSTL